MDEQLTDIGGVKNVTLKMSGDKVYSKMKRESGVHRVQRIPATESQGRLRHKPSGLIVTIGDSKSQLQNKEKARSVLRSRLYQIEMDKQQAELTSARLDQM